MASRLPYQTVTKIKVRVRVSSRVRVAVQFGSLSGVALLHC